ncbi:MAG: nuclease-related domain-containing protein, partial [Actinomycetota bacterium]
ELRAEHPTRSLAQRALRMKSDERSWRKGAFGERLNGWLLDRLPTGWHVFHDVSIGQRGANVDHVVVGPGGVFTVNTKYVKGKVRLSSHTLMVNGYRRDYLRKAATESDRAARLLSAALGRPVVVTGVLAIFADDWVIKGKPNDVFVGSPRGVTKWLRSLPTVLAPHEVNEVAAAANKPATWTARSRPAPRRPVR